MPPLAIQLLWLIATFVVMGIILWGISAWPNLDGTVKLMIRILVIVIFSVWAVYQIMGIVVSLPALPHR